MQRYEKYKDSGVDWIGEIPEGWEIRRIKTLFKEINERSFEGLEDLLSVSQYTGVTKKSDRVEEGDLLTNASTLEGYKIVRKNDLVSNIMLAWNGSLGFSPFDGITSPAYSVYRLKDIGEKQFFHYLFRTEKYKAEFKRQSSGVIESRLRLYSDDFFGIFSILPPTNEQQTIATFLDNKTAKIDQTIAIKQKEIELLKERRQILIQKAVTKGLDDTVKLKDSGVDWIGKIPEHWKVRKLKYCLNSKLKYGANESGVEYDLDLPRYIRITDFGFDGKLSEDKKLSLTWLQGKDYLLKDGDILFARSGATVGKSYQFKTSMSFEKHYSFAGYLIKAEANEEIILSDYLYLYTNSNLFDNWKSAIFNKATIENIGADKYATLSVVVPPVIEQKEILLEYNTKNEKIAKAISIKEQEIEKLKEYKTVLIDQVVTGKVKINYL